MSAEIDLCRTFRCVVGISVGRIETVTSGVDRWVKRFVVRVRKSAADGDRRPVIGGYPSEWRRWLSDQISSVATRQDIDGGCSSEVHRWLFVRGPSVAVRPDLIGGGPSRPHRWRPVRTPSVAARPDLIGGGPSGPHRWRPVRSTQVRIVRRSYPSSRSHRALCHNSHARTLCPLTPAGRPRVRGDRC